MNTPYILQTRQRIFSEDELRHSVSSTLRMDYDSIVRLSKYLPNDTSVFNTIDKCVIWQGYVKKNLTGELSIGSKKYPIGRILYHNYVNSLLDTQQISYTCDNKGRCATISHIKINKRKQKHHPKKENNSPIKEENLFIKEENLFIKESNSKKAKLEKISIIFTFD